MPTYTANSNLAKVLKLSQSSFA